MTRKTHESDLRWMREAIRLSRLCPPSLSAYSVGAIIVASGREISRGYSREDDDPHMHAEESALIKTADRPGLAGSTLYSTLEPCSQRRSRTRSCTELVIASGIQRVVIAWREPSLFVANAQGAELLTAAGIALVELEELAEDAKAVNRHLDLTVLAATD